jgi:hypothetical protein
MGKLLLGNLDNPILHHPIDCEKTVKPPMMGFIQPIEQKTFSPA